MVQLDSIERLIATCDDVNGCRYWSCSTVAAIIARVRELEAGLAEVETLAAQEVRVGMAADTRTAPPFAPEVLKQIEQKARAALRRRVLSDVSQGLGWSV